jgi:hypothetical protein
LPSAHFARYTINNKKDYFMSDKKISDGFISEIFQSLYSKYILKDILAKTIPGFIFLSTIILTKYPINIYYDFIKSLNPWYWIILYGFSWILGFAVQGLGEATTLIRTWPREVDTIAIDRNAWFDLASICRQKGNNSEILVNQRLGLIKESCGNNLFSLIILLIVSLFKVVFEHFTNKPNVIKLFYVDNKFSWIEFGSIYFYLLLIIISLLLTHIEHAKRQYIFLKKIKENHPEVENEEEADPVTIRLDSAELNGRFNGNIKLL